MQKFAWSITSLVVSISFCSLCFAKGEPDADNSAQNRGATRSDAVTAQKQGNEKDKINVLASIRKSIVDEKDLSMDAKNVKVLYSHGIVTLRGPVKDAVEKSKVEELAKGCEGVGRVKNLLTITSKH